MTERYVNWSYYTPESLSDRDEAADVLARLLRSQQLVLLLGAGVSKDLGLPSWSELVTRCAEQHGEVTGYANLSSSGEFMSAIDTLRRTRDLDKQQMFDTVRRGLYGAAVDRECPEHDFGAFESPLLSALGAVMMSSARGSAGEVFTLNFDDVLEWYLELHGFKSEVVTELPATLSGDVDVHVFHLHGFVPLDLERYSPSSWIVLSQKELAKRLAKGAEYPWEALLLNRLQTKVFVAIGTSMTDTDLKVSMEKASALGVPKRPYGFVLGKHDKDRVAEFYEDHLVPVNFDDYGDIPYFLLEVCQRAARFD